MTTSVLDGATAEHWQIVLDNTGLVWRHVNRLRIDEHERDDAYQDGLLGLLRAAQLYDPVKGYAFATYADAWIVNGIQRGHGRAMGRNYRRATERPWANGPWAPERSLQEPLSLGADGGSALLGDVIPSDRDTEWEGVFAATVNEAAVTVVGACRDVIDVEVAALMMEGELKGGQEIADRHGMSRANVSKRRARLQALARQHLDAA